MGKFTVTDPSTGKTATLTSADNTPPTEQELEQVFAGQSSEPQAQPEVALGDTGLTLPARSAPEPASEPSPLNPIERGVTAIPRTNDFKKVALSMLGVDPSAITEQGGKLMVHGKLIDPKPDGFASFFRDLPGDVAEGAVTLSPAIAQIATDVALTAGGPQNLPTLAVAGGAASAGAEGLRQTVSNQMTGEPFSGAEIATQGALGAATPYVGRGIEKVGEVAAKAIAKPMGLIAKKLGDSAPAVMETVGQIPRGETEHLVDAMRQGRQASEILNPKNADPSVAQNITRRTFFGHAQADESLPNFVSTFRQHYLNANPTDRPLIQDMYKQSWGLSDETMQQMAKYTPKDLLSAVNTSPQAYRSVSEDIIKTIREADTQLDVRYGSLLEKALTGAKAKATIDIKPGFDAMAKALDADTVGGVGILNGGQLSKTYEGPAKEVYRKVLDRFLKASGVNIEKEAGGEVFGGIGSSKNLAKFLENQNTGFAEVSRAIERMPAKEVYGIMRDLKPLLNKAFTNLEYNETRPLKEFLQGIRGQLDQLSPELAAFKPKYAAFNNLRDLFGTLNYGDAKAATQVQNTLKQAYADGSLRSYVSEIDNFVKGPKIMPRLNKLGAAQELSEIKDRGIVDKAKQGFINKLRKINSKGEGDILAKDEMNRWSSAIRQPSYKFAQEAKDHSTAVAYNSKPGNLFRARAIAYLMGAGTIASGNPMVGIPLLGMGMAAQSPANLGRAISFGQKATSGAMPQVPEDVLRGLLALSSRNGKQ